MIGTAVAVATMTLSVVLSMSRSGIALLGLGLLAMLALRVRGSASRWRRAALVSAVGVLVTASVAWAGADAVAARFTTWRDNSLYGRIDIWRDATELVRHFPWTGTGFNTFGVAMLFYQTTGLHELHAEAHNDYLQLAAEGGLLVGIPILALLTAGCAAIRQRVRRTPAGATRWIRSAAIIGLLVAAVQDIGDFSLQIPANTALFCVLAAIALSRVRHLSAVAW